MAQGKRLTNDEYLLRLKRVHGDKLVLLSEYQNRATKVRILCTDCDREWDANPGPLTTGTGCPHCVYNRPRTVEEHADLVRERFGDKVEVLDIGVYRCSCGDTFERKPFDMLKGKGICLNCLWLSRRMPPGPGLISFRGRVQYLSERNYKLYSRVLNPRGVRRSRNGWHLDHIYSVHDAFYNPKGLKHPVTMEECAHPANLRLIFCSENMSKSHESDISASELRRRIAEFDRQHGRAW